VIKNTRVAGLLCYTSSSLKSNVEMAYVLSNVEVDESRSSPNRKKMQVIRCLVVYNGDIVLYILNRREGEELLHMTYFLVNSIQEMLDAVDTSVLHCLPQRQAIL